MLFLCFISIYTFILYIHYFILFENQKFNKRRQLFLDIFKISILLKTMKAIYKMVRYSFILDLIHTNCRAYFVHI